MPERRTDHEVELAVVIGREGSRIAKANALEHVAGYSIGLDITIRGSEDRSFRKSPDGFSVLGPWLVTADEIPDPGTLDLHIAVNGEQRQKSNTRYLILGVPELIELASSFYTLYPGDVIYTGTPEGVSPIDPGDQIVATIERIGTMRVGVRAAEGTGIPADERRQRSAAVKDTMEAPGTSTAYFTKPETSPQRKEFLLPARSKEHGAALGSAGPNHSARAHARHGACVVAV
jgi:hypothetical protein